MTAAKIGERLQGKKAASPHRIARNSETVWGMRVNQAMERRVLREAEYIAATGATVRKTASVLGVSKSTVHKDMESRLARLSAPLHREVAAVMAKNKAERHLRGGEATKRRYAKTEA